MIANQSLEILEARVRKSIPDPDRVLRVCMRDGQKSRYVEVIVDLHGLNRQDALTLARNVIAVCKGVRFKLTLVHGKNRGQVLMTALRTSLNNPRIESRYQNFYNKGVTHLWIAEGAYRINWMAA